MCYHYNIVITNIYLRNTLIRHLLIPTYDNIYMTYHVCFDKYLFKNGTHIGI